jgi:hypothetical protein
VNVGQYVQPRDQDRDARACRPATRPAGGAESAVTSVKRGQKVAFWVQNYPGRAFEGTIAYVGRRSRPSRARWWARRWARMPTRRIPAAGLFATARIELPAAEPMPYVPASACYRGRVSQVSCP